ncbi:TIGR03084 family metal-binding protein [Solwaraspora sp. WMMD791]|uniref:TIGR03084 family metal-binding protein n=1 Tax=Solwaraspora sp. WMMD791 TaxID=3016086 RepID=UPI00249A2375|nr:TIGR03084 family metal-binding protein [Solwaraspora sp. WMMD791]WFE29921.1 TIGR03084 family metal-binding protein [Solwaraspora sp. WMMD791]
MSQKLDVISALSADGAAVDQMVSGLDAGQWRLETPAAGWTIAHQIAHLAATFRMAALAAADPAGFTAMAARLSPDFNANVERALAEYLADPPQVLLTRWRAERTAAEKALAAVPADQVVPWLVRPLPPAVLAAAGMMELFGHGQDIADTLGVRPTRTDRIGFLVGFAVRTWDFGYLARDLPTPEVEFRFELTAPSGTVWEYGPADSSQRITGPAEDFCLLVTRRRHRADLALTAEGDEADRWLDIAQAYRGPAGPGRRPGQFANRG